MFVHHFIVEIGILLDISLFLYLCGLVKMDSIIDSLFAFALFIFSLSNHGIFFVLLMLKWAACFERSTK